MLLAEHIPSKAYLRLGLNLTEKWTQPRQCHLASRRWTRCRKPDAPTSWPAPMQRQRARTESMSLTERTPKAWLSRGETKAARISAYSMRREKKRYDGKALRKNGSHAHPWSHLRRHCPLRLRSPSHRQCRILGSRRMLLRLLHFCKVRALRSYYPHPPRQSHLNRPCFIRRQHTLH